MQVRVKLTHPKARMPTRAKPGDVGYDIYACEGVVIMPGASASIDTGVMIQLPPPVRVDTSPFGVPGTGRVAIQAQVQGRSGLAFKGDIVTHTGTIDTGYRGQIGVKLWAIGSDLHIVKAGDRVAQLVFSIVLLPTLVRAGWLNEGDRGERGYGSTGR